MRRSMLLLVASPAIAAASPRVEISGSACDLSGLLLDSPATARVAVAMSAAGEDETDVVAAITFPGGAQRIVRASSCAELVDAVALVIDLVLSEAPAATVQAPAVPVRAAEAPPASPRAQTALDLVATGASGVSSHGWEQALIIGAEWRRDVRSLGVEVRAAVPDHQAIEPTAQLEVWSAGITVSPCVHLGAFAGCATATAGTIVGAGQGLVDTRHAATPLLAGGLRLAWDRALGPRLALRLQVDAEAAVTTSRFDIDHMPVWSSDRFTVWGGAGVIAHFP